MHTLNLSAPALAQTQALADVHDSADFTKIRAISLAAVGVVALLSYFFHIDYFPLFDLQAAASYLFAVTWVLAVLLITLALTLLLPYALINWHIA